MSIPSSNSIKTATQGDVCETKILLCVQQMHMAALCGRKYEVCDLCQSDGNRFTEKGYKVEDVDPMHSTQYTHIISWK